MSAAEGLPADRQPASPVAVDAAEPVWRGHVRAFVRSPGAAVGFALLVLTSSPPASPPGSCRRTPTISPIST